MSRPRKPRPVEAPGVPPHEQAARAEALRVRFEAVMRLLEEKRAAASASDSPPPPDGSAP